MDLGALAPEITSARMYSGPGSAPLMAAASAWNRLAAELSSAATGYDTVITQLTSQEWLGPASASMAGAVTPYVAWMSTTATRAEQAATQVRAAAGAYETAFAAVVPPPLIAANRVQQASLVSTNVLGQNTAALAANEAQYGQMWAQNAAAMYHYAGSSATASTVTPFTAPPQAASPAALATQGAAVTQATATSAGTAQSTLTQMISALPSTLQSLASPVSSTAAPAASSSGLSSLSQLLTGSSTPPSSLSGLLTDFAPYASFLYYTEGLPYFSIGMGNNFVQTAKTLGLISGAAAPAAAAAGGAANAVPGVPGLGGLLGGGPLSAGLGNAASVGRLSVPPAWNGPLPGMHPGAAPLPVSSISAAPDAGAGNLLGGMPLAGVGAGAAGAGPRYGFRPTVMARPPFAG